MFTLSVVAAYRAAVVFARLGLLSLIAIAPCRAQAETLSVERAQTLALSGQPLLESKYAAIHSAREASISARELPDPKLKFGFLNVPIEGPDALSLTREAMTMTMVGVMQEFPREDKRRLRSELLRLEGERNVRELAFLRRQVRRETALAWMNAWTAERALDLLRAQQGEAETEIKALAIGFRNNRVNAADVSAARVESALLKDREQMLIGELRVARAALARWIGDYADSDLPEDFPSLPAPLPAEILLSKISAHPHLATYDIQAHIADTDAQLADLSRKPDWSMEVAYGKRGSAYSDMVSLQFQIDLPVLQTNRQDRIVAAKFATAQQARDLRDDNLREMRAEAQRLHALWEVADQRAKTYSERILPEARLRLQAVLAAYRGGTGSLSAVLAVRRALLDLELDALRRRAEVATAAFALHYFAQATEAEQ